MTLCKQESKVVLKNTWEGIVQHLQSKYTIFLGEYVGEIFWDGRPEVVSFFRERFPLMLVHLKACLKHARDKTRDAFQGEMKQALSLTMDWTAFLPPLLFHVSFSLLIANLRAGGEQEDGLKYLDGGDGIGSLHLQNGLYTGRWQSHYLCSTRGFHTYSNNGCETWWKTEDVVHGEAPMITVKKYMDACKSNLKEYKRTGMLAAISHAPCGVNAIPNNLMGGDGLIEGQGTLYAKKFQRLTVEKLKKIHAQNQAMVLLGPKGGFLRCWVVISKSQEEYNEEEMRLFGDLFFSNDIGEIMRLFPKNSLGQCNSKAFQRMYAKYMVVGESIDHDYLNLSRAGMIRWITEHDLFVRAVWDESFDRIYGEEPGAAAKAKAKAKPLGKKAARFKRAMATLLGADPTEEDAAVPIPDCEGALPIQDGVPPQLALMQGPASLACDAGESAGSCASQDLVRVLPCTFAMK